MGSITDALKYVQLGSPENIVILPEAGAVEMERAASQLQNDVAETATLAAAEEVGCRNPSQRAESVDEREGARVGQQRQNSLGRDCI